LPVPLVLASVQKPVIAIVDQILAAKSASPQTDTRTLERLVDTLVYRLYNLTYYEV
jgi:hypothetical protein